MVEKKNNKGFSGLLSLVSNIDDSDNGPTIEARSKKQSSTDEATDNTQTSGNLVHKYPNTSSTRGRQRAGNQLTVPNPKQIQLPPKEEFQPNAPRWWRVGLIALVLAILAFISFQLNIRDVITSYFQPSLTKESISEGSLIPSSDLEYSEPPIGEGYHLSISQIRWCLREYIRINSLHTISTTEQKIEKLRALIDEYFKRCKVYFYDDNDMTSAQIEIESNEEKINAEALRSWKFQFSSLNKSGQLNLEAIDDSIESGILTNSNLKSQNASSLLENKNSSRTNKRTKQLQNNTLSKSDSRSSQSNLPSESSDFHVDNFEFTEPPMGVDKILTISEIRWCIREDVEIELIRSMAITNPQIIQFNSMVTNYNSRCSNFRYRDGTLTRAIKDIESVREQIISSAVPPWQKELPVSQEILPNSNLSGTQQQSNNPSELVQQIQKSLAVLGYNPGPFDGIYGSQTKSAIHAFENANGMQASGNATLELLTILQESMKRNAVQRSQ